jgi:3-isopropylmalate/(R)-2-methylmalate dehydratase small subunit
MTEAFTRLHATCVPFVKDDLDTDQIIPARFLTGTTKTGLGEKLFYDWRYDEQGGMKADSIFDNARYSGAQVLVSGHNFGCGSSREHAPWSLKDYGIRAIFAVSFADIFYNNALKNFLLPVALPQEVIQVLAERIEQDPGVQVDIDLALQQVTIPGQGQFAFEINGFRKKCLLEGLDDVAYVLSYLPQIEGFEQQEVMQQWAAIPTEASSL